MSAMRDEYVQFLNDYPRDREVFNYLLQTQFGAEACICDVPEQV